MELCEAIASWVEAEIGVRQVNLVKKRLQHMVEDESSAGLRDHGHLKLSSLCRLNPTNQIFLFLITVQCLNIGQLSSM